MNNSIPDSPIACTIDPQSWDLDEGSYRAGRDAISECVRCPRLDLCRTELSVMVAAKTPPKALIWAGIAFTHRGRQILNEDAFKSYYRRVAAQRAVGLRTAA